MLGILTGGNRRASKAVRVMRREHGAIIIVWRIAAQNGEICAAERARLINDAGIFYRARRSASPIGASIDAPRALNEIWRALMQCGACQAYRR